MLLGKGDNVLRVVLVLLAWSLAGMGSASQGYIEKAGTRMPIADSVAVMDEKLNRLSIYLLPTRLTKEEKRRITNTSALMVLMNKGSPDSRKWDGYPYAKLELQNRSSRFDSVDNLYGYALMLHGILQRNQANTVNGHFADQEILRGYRFDGQRVRFTFSGQRKAIETRWDLKVNAPLIKGERAETDTRRVAP